MKKFTLTTLFSITLLIGSAAAQEDTVCASTPSTVYQVTNNPGSIYAWVVVGGTISAGFNTNSITVDWGAAPGLFSVSVIETNSFGCAGAPVSLPVRILPLPTALLTGDNMICQGNTSSMALTLTGIGPWNVTYNDGTSNTTLNNISSNSHIFSSPVLNSSKTYTLVTVTDSHCVGTTLGTAAITVNPKPVTSAITRQ